MKNIILLLIALIPSTALADRPCFTCPPVAKKSPVKSSDRVIINNTLIGIPVPVVYAQPIALQGTTYYGTGLSGFRYGTDLNVVFNQANRFLEQSQQLVSQGYGGFLQALVQEGQNQAVVAQTIAQGQAAAAALHEARPQPTAGVAPRTFTFQVTTDADGTMRIGSAPVVNEEARSGATAGPLVTKHCAACHQSGGEGVVRFRIDGPLSDPVRLHAIRTVMLPLDDPRHMPRGLEIPGEELAQLVAELSGP